MNVCTTLLGADINRKANFLTSVNITHNVQSYLTHFPNKTNKKRTYYLPDFNLCCSYDHKGCMPKDTR